MSTKFECSSNIQIREKKLSIKSIPINNINYNRYVAMWEYRTEVWHKINNNHE